MLTIGSGWIGCAATLTLPCPGPRFVNDSLSFPSRTSQQDTALALAQRGDCDALRVERPDQDTGRMAFAAEQHQARTLALSNALARRDSRGTSAERRLERLAAERARPGAGAFLSNSLPRRVPHPRHTCECASSQAAA